METSLVLSTAVLMSQRNHIPIFKIFHLYWRILKLVEMTLESTWKSMLHITSCYRKKRKKLTLSFKLERGPIITPLLLFDLERTGSQRLFGVLHYTPRRCFESFVQNVDSRREIDQNIDSTVVAETMKLIGNSSYGYKIMDRSRHTSTKYAKGSQVDKFVNNRFFESLNELLDQIYELEMSQKRIEH